MHSPAETIRLSLRCLHSSVHSAHTLSLPPSLSPLFLALLRSLSRALAFSPASTRVRVCAGKLVNIHSLPPSLFSLLVRVFSSLASSLPLAVARSLSLFLFLFLFLSLVCSLSFTHTHTLRLQPIAEYVCAAGSGRLRARPQRLRWRRLHRPRLQPPRLLLKHNPIVYATCTNF